MAKILRWQEIETASTFWLPPFTSRCGCQSRLLRTWTQQSTQLIVTQQVLLCLSREVPATSQPSRFSSQRQIRCEWNNYFTICSPSLLGVPFRPHIDSYPHINGSLRMWSDRGASCCHVYVVINQLGLFARSVQSTNRLSVPLCVRSPYVTPTGVSRGEERGVRTDMRQQMNPVNQEFTTPAVLKYTLTHAAISLPHRKLWGPITSMALQNNPLKGKISWFFSVLAINLIIQRTRCPLLTRSLVPGYLIRHLTDYFVLIALSNGGKQYGSFSAWPEDLPAGGDVVGWMWSPESPSVRTSLWATPHWGI